MALFKINKREINEIASSLIKISKDIESKMDEVKDIKNRISGLYNNDNLYNGGTLMDSAHTNLSFAETKIRKTIKFTNDVLEVTNVIEASTNKKVSLSNSRYKNLLGNLIKDYTGTNPFTNKSNSDLMSITSTSSVVAGGIGTFSPVVMATDEDYINTSAVVSKSGLSGLTYVPGRRIPENSATARHIEAIEEAIRQREEEATRSKIAQENANQSQQEQAVINEQKIEEETASNQQTSTAQQTEQQTSATQQTQQTQQTSQQTVNVQSNSNSSQPTTQSVKPQVTYPNNNNNNNQSTLRYQNTSNASQTTSANTNTTTSNSTSATTTSEATSITDESITGNTADLFEVDDSSSNVSSATSSVGTSTSTGGSGIGAVAAGLGAAAAVGVGVKVYKDRKENNEFDLNEDRPTNENKYWTDEESNVIHSEKEDFAEESSIPVDGYTASSNVNNIEVNDEDINNDTWSMPDASSDNSNILGN